MHNKDGLLLQSMQMWSLTCQSRDGSVLTDTVTAWWQQLKNLHSFLPLTLSLLVYIYNRSILMHFSFLILHVLLHLVQRHPHISQATEILWSDKGCACWYASSVLLYDICINYTELNNVWGLSVNIRETHSDFFLPKSQESILTTNQSLWGLIMQFKGEDLWINSKLFCFMSFL